ncbi:MAG: prolipoprotein diacylglyceryl transferase [Chloroflexales bacterium]|nr:prolipoprotein diacylglyceryl transferase [Chloroflexales bacterium]
MHPPTGPYLIHALFGQPWLSVRWYGVLIMGGAILAALLAARRAQARGIDPEHVWNQLLLGLLLAIPLARAYYIAFEWPRYAGRPWWEIVNPQGGGLAIHGGLLGALLAVVIYTRRQRLPLLGWLDICAPPVLLGQAIGRWGNFFNQEAYGRPTTLPWGLAIDPPYRLPPYDDLTRFPLSTRFHPTFLYESLWDLSALGLILWVERRFAGWLKPGDSLLLYGVCYSLGRFFTEGLRTDSLCVGPYTADGSCVGGLRIAQVVSLSVLIGCGLTLWLRHRRRRVASVEVA